MRERAPSPHLPGSVNGRYRVVKLLGQGGVGRVYLVEDAQRGGLRMALKTILPEAAGRALAAGFREEFSQLAKLEHPNLARAYDFGRIEGTSEHFFTSEFVDGVNAWQGTKESSCDDLIDLAIQALRALDFIHVQGILHNDLKPANLLLTAGGSEPRRESSRAGSLGSLVSAHQRLKLIDFGLISREGTAWSTVLGTPAFLSPERIRREKADRRSDLYSLGAVLFSLFARRPPFHSDDVRELLRQHTEDPPTPLRRYRPEASAAVEEFVQRLLAKRPEDRFQSAAEAIRFLERGLSSRSIEVPVAPARAAVSPGSLLHREAELARLEGLLLEARMASTKTVGAIVRGPRGVGKTRLVSELRAPVQVAGGVFVEVGGAAVEGNLQPLAEAWIAALQTAGWPSAEDLGRRITAGRGEDFAEAIEKTILQQSKEALVVLFFDDYERSSRTVRRFITGLLLSAEEIRAARGKALRLLAIVAKEGDGEAPELAAFELPVLDLRPFSPEEARAFLHGIFHQDLPEEFSERMIAVAGGNPLFLLELSRSLVREGAATFTRSGWSFAPSFGEASLPDSLDRLLRERIRTVDDRAREILEFTAIAKRPVSKTVLALCTGYEPRFLERTLGGLLEKNLIFRASNAPAEEEYSWPHAGARDAVLERLPPERICELHARLARSLEAASLRWEERADELAGHWLAAGNRSAFLRFGPKAAELLESRGDLESAARYRELLVEEIPPTAIARKIQSLGRLAETYEFLWDLGACAGTLERIEAAGEGLLAPLDRALLSRRAACVEIARARYDRALERLERASAVLESQGGAYRFAAAAPRILARWLSGRVAEARAELDEVSAAISSGAPPPGEKERALWLSSRSHLAVLYQQAGALDAATRFLEGNLAVLRETSQRQATAATQCLLGQALLEGGRYGEALRHLEDALRQAKEIGDRRTLCRARDALAQHHLRFGKLRRAARLTAAGIQDAESFRSGAALAGVLRTLGRLHHESDAPGEAREALLRGLEKGAADADPLSVGLLRLELAKNHIRAGEPAAARPHLEACAGEGRRLEMPLLAGLAALWTFVARWKEAGVYAGSAVEEARAIFERHGYHGERIDLVLEQCEVEIEAGNLERARALVEELRELTAEHREPDLSAESQFLLGRWHAQRGERREALALLSRARKSALEMKKRRLARRCEESLEPVPAR